MPVLFSSSDASVMSERVLWVDDYVSRADSGLLTPTSESLGFKTYIPSSAKAHLALGPIEYLTAFRDQLAKPVYSRHPRAPTELQGPPKQEVELLLPRAGRGMVEPVAMQAPTVTLTRNHTESPDRPNLTTRKSASFHKNLITKLRPLPFQYVWTVYHDKSVASASSSPDTTESNSTTSATAYTDRFTTLAPSVPDIAEFYKVFNNTPWSAVKSRDTVHIFRAGVKPLWEDPENIDGGCWTLKVRKQQLQAGDDDRSRPKRVWEEICLMGCGGELQAALAESGSRDHVLGMSFSPRLYWVHVSVWLKQGGDAMSTAVVQRTVLERLSPELRPKDQSEYFFKKHSEHEGWEQAVGRKKTGE